MFSKSLEFFKHFLDIKKVCFLCKKKFIFQNIRLSLNKNLDIIRGL